MPEDLNQETAIEEVSADPAVTQDTATSTDGAIQGQESQAAPTTEGTQQKQSDNFYDPNNLPEELKPIWKKMQGTYTKKMQDIKGIKDKAAIIDRFQSDPQYAQSVLQQTAAQMGFQLTRAEAKAALESTQRTSDVPESAIKAIENKLPPELKWMAESLASATMEGFKVAYAPKEEQEQLQRQRSLEEQYDMEAENLTSKAPGWEEHEDDMNEMLDFLQSGNLNHKRFGSKLELLYNMVNNNALANKTVMNRMAGAAKSRISTGQPTSRTMSSNYTDRMLKAPSRRDAFDIATQKALEDLAQMGINPK